MLQNLFSLSSLRRCSTNLASSNSLHLVPRLLFLTGFLFLTSGLAVSTAQAQFSENTVTRCTVCAPASTSAADFDGDGDTDLLSGAEGDGQIAWHENDGSTPPSFTLRTVSTAPRKVYDLQATDLDGDGHTDILAATDDEIIWYENDGSGDPTFSANTIATLSNARTHFEAVYAANVDGQNGTDVVSVADGINDAVAWHENNGSEAFTEREIDTNFFSTNAVNAADIDDDGDTDIFAVGNDKVFWYENDGASDPSFAPRTELSTPGSAYSIDIADINGDSELDVISGSTGFTNWDISWHKNDGASNPSFSRQDIASPPPSDPRGGQSVRATDLDNDGDLDVLTNYSITASTNRIAWYEHDGSTPPNFTFNEITNSLQGASSPFPAPIDGDSNLDIVAGATESGKVVWYAGDGTGGFSPENVVEGPSFASDAADVHAANLDGDDDVDLISASSGNNKVAWYENDGSQTFTARPISTSATFADAVHAADIDKDDDVDILAAADSDIAWYENDGAGDPTFSSNSVATSLSLASSVYTADLDNDNDLDVLSASRGDDKIAWHENDGNADPSFSSNIITSSADRAQSVYAADVDGDGDTDVLSASEGDNTVAWHENDGANDPSFTTRNISTSASSPQSIFAADLDDDGDTDVLAASEGDNTVAWYENDGANDPSFTKRDISTSASSPQSVFATDVDGDGNTDVLAALDSDKIVWYEHDGNADPSFTAQPVSANTLSPTAVDTADIDDDGKPDVLSASSSDSKIAWHKNSTTSSSDNTDPTVTQIVRSAPSSGRTNQSSVTFTVSFSESVVNIGPDDFTLNSDADVSAALAGTSTNSGTSTEVTVNAISGDGTLGLDLDSGGDIEDQAGNPLDTAEPSTDETYTVDNTPPSVPSGLSTRIESGTVVLSWDDAGSVDEYRIYRDTAPISDLSGHTPLATQSAGTTSYTDPDTEQGTTYYYHVTTVDAVGNESALSDAEKATLTSSEITETKLLPNAPNPFSGSTTISYQLAEEQQVTITIYNELGRRVTTLVNTVRSSGDYNVTWNAGNANRLGSGVYFCRMEAGSYTESEKLVLV